MKSTDTSQPRARMSKHHILAAAINLADQRGVAALSMRNLARELGVVPMALYKHVVNKEALLNGVIDVVIGEIERPPVSADWKTAIRQRVLAARSVMLRHPWASQVIESREQPTPGVIAYLDAMIGMFRAGGFSIDVTHHAMHAMGSRLLGFSQELFDDSASAAVQPEPEMLAALAAFPYISELVTAVTHDQGSIVGSGCDDQFEFEFALDLMLDGLERLRVAA